MKKIIFYLVTISSVSFSQIYYHSDFTPCNHIKVEKTSITEYCKIHNINIDTLYTPPGAMDRQFNAVYFVLFTDKPAFGVMVNGDGEKMRNIVDKLNLDNFFYSSAMEEELNKIISKKNMIFTTAWIKNKLGIPSRILELKNSSYEYFYNDLNIILSFRNEYLTSYRQIEKYRLI